MYEKLNANFLDKELKIKVTIQRNEFNYETHALYMGLFKKEIN